MRVETKYPVFQNKSLDYNKLLGEQKRGKLLKKVLKFPLIAMIKYDGHYCIISIKGNSKTFTSSGGIRYSHNINLGFLPGGEYIAERIVGDGKLGASRRGVALEGSIGSKFAKPSNTYKIHNHLGNDEYSKVLENLCRKLPISLLPQWKMIATKGELNVYMKEVTRDGYEGLMLVQPSYIFKNTKSRHIDFCKYKKRPTADLLCIGTADGGGKYTGMIGSLLLQDSKGRQVMVGSGMSDEDRQQPTDYFYGKVVEIEYEQIADTYIQPTFNSDTVGVTIRNDKTKEEID